MLNGKKIVVVLPAYNAELTLRQTYEEIPMDIGKIPIIFLISTTIRFMARYHIILKDY